MMCMKCGTTAEKGFTTSVTELGNCLVIIRNVPCFKCSECNEITYTADVVKRLEDMITASKNLLQEISIIDYAKAS